MFPFVIPCPLSGIIHKSRELSISVCRSPQLSRLTTTSSGPVNRSLKFNVRSCRRVRKRIWRQPFFILSLISGIIHTSCKSLRQLSTFPAQSFLVTNTSVDSHLPISLPLRGTATHPFTIVFQTISSRHELDTLPWLCSLVVRFSTPSSSTKTRTSSKSKVSRSQHGYPLVSVVRSHYGEGLPCPRNDHSHNHLLPQHQHSD